MDIQKVPNKLFAYTSIDFKDDFEEVSCLKVTKKIFSVLWKNVLRWMGKKSIGFELYTCIVDVCELVRRDISVAIFVLLCKL